MESSSNGSSSNSSSKSGYEILDYELRLPAWSLENLKTAAYELRLSRPRSLAWAILLYAVPPPGEDIVKSVKIHRRFYEDLKSKLSMDPRAVIGDDPLSQNDESAWKQHFCDNELKALILQDVVRTFPDEVYFRDKNVQDLMVRVLFFWARSHSIGYRQGMHEILAPLLFELYTDRKCAPIHLCDTLKYVLEDSYLEHDSYMLFNSVMKGLERFYTTGDVVPSPCGRLPMSNAVHNPNEVIRYLDRIRDQYLIPLDPELAAHLDACNITMELFGIRWLRLLFGREFPRTQVSQLWGFLFADGPTFPHLHYVVLAILVTMRNVLLRGTTGDVLCTLMRPLVAAVTRVTATARHLRAPNKHPLPELQDVTASVYNTQSSSTDSWSLEQTGNEDPSLSNESGSEGVAEGADVARELAALALVRARLPSAAAALAKALPKPGPDVQQPLQTILQLAALLQCRNHAIIDVETALEADEGQMTDKVGRRQLVPVAMIGGRIQAKPVVKPKAKVKEVPLKVFHQAECITGSDLPSLDPLRLRTE